VRLEAAMIARDAQAAGRGEHDVYLVLAARHHELDARLLELSRKPYLSAREDLEEHTLKKEKLALKDQMTRLEHARA